uniref:Ovule protein n=1 Tax=Syphacia muris TaxID=451379 RepID=A0A0N5AFR7_9BILA
MLGGKEELEMGVADKEGRGNVGGDKISKCMFYSATTMTLSYYSTSAADTALFMSLRKKHLPKSVTGLLC